MSQGGALAQNNNQYAASPQRILNTKNTNDQKQNVKNKTLIKPDAIVRGNSSLFYYPDKFILLKKGRKLGDKEVDVVCLQQSQDSDREHVHYLGRPNELQQHSLANQDGIQLYHMLNSNSKSYQSLPQEFHQHQQQYSSGVSQQQTQREANNNVKTSYQQLARKSSVDSKTHRNKSSSQDRNEKIKKKSSSNSAQRSKIDIKKQQEQVKHVASSPNINLFNKNPSQQLLPPKPSKLTQRGSVFSAISEGQYQSTNINNPVISHKTSHPDSQFQKRAPSISIERQQAEILKMSASQNAFSPLRRKQKEFNSTMPTSNQKSALVKRSKKRDNLQQKSKQLKPESTQTLSPNIERVKVKKLVIEKSEQVELAQNPSFEESEINNRQSLNEGSDHSQNSIREQEKQLQKTKNMKNYYQDIFKTIKQQLSATNLKKEKYIKNEEGKIKLNTQRTGKINLEQMKLKMNKKLEGKSLALKKKPVQSTKNDIEIARLKKQEIREEWQKQREQRQECIEMVKDALSAPVGQSIKRDLSQSQKRPFNMKVSTSQQQLFVQVPPVNIEKLAHIQESGQSQDQQRHQISPSRDKIQDGFLTSQSKGQLQAKPDQSETVSLFLQKQKRLRSKQRKNEEIKEIFMDYKKDKALKTLEEQYKKQFEQFKMNIVGSSKIKVKMQKFGRKNDQQQQITKKIKRIRSKSKRRLDEEKENRIEAYGSISPGRGVQIVNTLSRSEKRQNKKKKIMLHSTSSVAQLKIMTKNVKEILALQKDEDKMKKLLKSHTLKDLNPKKSLKIKSKDQTRAYVENMPQQQYQQSLQKSNASSFNQRLSEHKPDLRHSYEQQEQYQQLPGMMQFRISSNSSQNILFQQPSESMSMQIGGISSNITPVREYNQQARYPVGNQLQQSNQSHFNMTEQNQLENEDKAKSLRDDLRIKSTDFNKGSLKGESLSSSLKANGIGELKQIYQVGEVQGNLAYESKNKKNLGRPPAHTSTFQPYQNDELKSSIKDHNKIKQLMQHKQYPQEFYVGSAIIIQGYLRKYIALKKVKRLQNEKREKYYVQQFNKASQNSQLAQKINQSSPLRTSYDPKIKKIQVINDSSQNQELSSIISRHSVVPQFKQIPHFEDDKFGHVTRQEQDKPQSHLNPVDSSSHHYQGLDQIRQTQEKVQGRIDYQYKINEQAKNDANQIKSMTILESASSNNYRQHAQNESSQKYLQQKEEGQRRLNKHSDFDSLSSLNKLSKDYEGPGMNKNYTLSQASQHKGNITDRTDGNRRDSFLIQVIQKISEQSNVSKNQYQAKNNTDEYLLLADKRNKISAVKKGNTSGVSQHSQILLVNPPNDNKTGRKEAHNSYWNLSGRQNQEQSERGSQLLQEESKKQISTLSVSTYQKSKIMQNKLNVFEEMLEELTQKANKGREKLKKFSEMRQLSPGSQQKRLELEKWVTKQEKQLIKQKKWYMDNVDDMITKIDKDIKSTKNLIGSKRSNSSNIFNNSIEMSYDMSIMNTQSQHSIHSIHSTPRIVKPVALNNEINLPVQMGDKVIQKLPFEYKEPQKVVVEDQMKQQPQILIHRDTLQSQRSTDPIIADDQEQMDQQSAMSRGQDQVQTEQDNSEPRITMGEGEREQPNIFNENLASQPDMSINLSQIKLEDDEDMRNDHDTSSLSQMDPPHFQSPMMSAVSQATQKKGFNFDEESLQHDVPQDFDLFKGSKPDQQDADSIQNQQKDIKIQQQLDFDIDQKIAEGENQMSEQRLSSSLLINDIEEMKEEHRSLQEAFSALKEPDQQTNQAVANIEENTELITDYILQALVEQIRFNMYPKRAYIELPKAKDTIQIDETKIDPQQNAIDQKQSEDDLAALPMVQMEGSEEHAAERAGDQNLLLPEIDQKETDLEGQKPKLRGIKTSIRIVDNYVAEIFKKIKDSEDEFVENLSTPLNKDPLEILLHLQNVYIDAEMENGMAFQQSVLPVDLYLELERNKQFVQKVDTSTDEEPTNKSMLAEWENIHNKVIFDGINEAFDNFRPYGLKGPPMPWSQQTRTLTYKNGQQVDNVLKQVRQKVVEWARTFSGALPCSELLLEYGIRGPLDEDKLNLLREERLALVLASEIEENEQLWTDYEYEETQTKLDVADMILEVLAEEAVKQFNDIKEAREANGAQDEEITETE